MSEQDIFWRSDIYPDATSLLGFEYLPLSVISDNAVVILDASVLIQPYEVDSKELVNDLDKVYRKLAGEKRLIVPGQSAREYITNRPKKIAAVVSRIEQAKERINKVPLDKIPHLENDEAFTRIRALWSEGKADRASLTSLLDLAANKVRSDPQGDRVAILYRTILSGCIFDVDYKIDERKTIIEDMERRQRLKIGPGYKDSRKDDLGVGDLLIWRSVLEQGKLRKAHCIFVSQETKSDWWAPDGGKFQLRPELIDEFRQASEGHCVHMIPLSTLLSMFGADPTTVSEVVDAEERDSKRSSFEDGRRRNLESRLQSTALWSSISSAQGKLEDIKAYVESASSTLDRLIALSNDKNLHPETRKLYQQNISALSSALSVSSSEKSDIEEKLSELLYFASIEAVNDE